MWKRQWVVVRFVVNGFKFQGITYASVNVDENGKLIEKHIEDPKYLADVEFLEPLIDNYNYEDIPKEGELTEQNLEQIVQFYL